MNNFANFLNQGLKKLRISISQGQKDQCQHFAQLLLEWNEKINLTAIKDAEGIAIKHFLDAFAAGQFINWDQPGKLVDLGSGAGFPGLVFKIWQPDWQINLVDAVQKKTRFLSLVCDELALEKIDVYHSRGEDLGQNRLHREKYDVVVARGVAGLSTLSEYCLPLSIVNGYFYAFKGLDYQEEITLAEEGIKILGGSVEEVHEYNLPLKGDPRSLIVIKKQNRTPKLYPRKSGVPKKKPL